MQYLVIIEQSEHGYRAYAPDLPDCVAMADTEAEVLHLIQDIPCCEPVNIGGMQLAYEVSGTQQGISWIAEASGLPVRSTMTQSLAGEITMNDSMSWPIEMETRTVMQAED